MVLNILLIGVTLLFLGFTIKGVYLIATAFSRPDVTDKGVFYLTTFGMLFLVSVSVTSFFLFT